MSLHHHQPYDKFLSYKTHVHHVHFQAILHLRLRKGSHYLQQPELG